LLIQIELDIPRYEEGQEEKIKTIIQRLIDDHWTEIKEELNE